MSQAKNGQESVLSLRFRHGTSSANRMEYHQTCVHAVCVIVQYDMTHGHPLMEIWSEMDFVYACVCVYCMPLIIAKNTCFN